LRQLLVVTSLWFGLVGLSFADKFSEEDAQMHAKGTFEVDLTPQADADSPAGRMVIDKNYLGDMNGSGIGQMISKRTVSGAAVYYAIEEFSGSVKGKSGAFTLIHKGYMSKESQSLEVVILEGSGSGELENISGSMVIVQDANGHTYELTYEL
jgi:hypothetical protein